MIKLMKNWKYMDSRNQKKIYFIILTVMFVVTSILCFGYFFKNDKAFFWIGGGKDGLSQNYNCLVYFSDYLKTIFENIFIHHNFIIPQWEFGLGYGADIITTTGFVTIGDVFNWFSVFVPEKSILFFYHFMGYFRLYLAGIVFSFYCFRMKQKIFPTFIGAFIYMFSGYALINLPREVFFINPMIYLPLLLLGAEKIMDNEKPYIFIVAIFLSVIGSFQFFYILCLVTFIYVLIRFFMKYKEKYWLMFIKVFCRFVIFGLIGMMIGGFVFIPTIMRFLSDSRSGLGGFDLFYPITYYKLLLPSLISYQIPGGSTTHIVMTPVIFISIVSLFLHLKKDQIMTILVFVLATLFVVFPIGGFIMNGLSITSNRWIFTYSFILSYLFVMTYDALLHYSKKQLLVIDCLFILYCILCFIFLDTKINYTLPSLVILGFAIIILNIYNLFKFNKIMNYVYSSLILVTVFSGFVSNAYFINSKNYGNHPNQFLDYSQAYSTLKGTGINAISKISENGFYRYEDLNSGTKSFFNSGLNYRVGSPNYFFSLSNPYTQRFYNDLEIGSGNPLFFENLNSRSILQSLASIKYISVSDKIKSKVSSQYKLIQSSNENSDNVNIYENTNCLPIGYTYQDSISLEEYNKSNVVDKQKLLSEYIVLDNSKSIPTSYKKTLPVDYNLQLGENVVSEDGKFIVKKKNATIKLYLSSLKVDELYVSFSNLSYKSISPLNNYTEDQLKNLSKEEKLSYESWQPYNSTYVTVKGEESETVQLRTSDNIYYNSDKVNYSVNVKNINKKDNSLTIQFSKEGEYYYDDIEVLPLVLDQVNDNIDMLKTECLEDVSIQENKISGHINVKNNKFLCLSIPYTDGWSAYVDGIETEIVPANIMYMGLELKSGSHEIVLKYATPGLKTGGLLTVLGFVSILGVIYIERRKTVT